MHYEMSFRPKFYAANVDGKLVLSGNLIAQLQDDLNAWLVTLPKAEREPLLREEGQGVKVRVTEIVVERDDALLHQTRHFLTGMTVIPSGAALPHSEPATTHPPIIVMPVGEGAYAGKVPISSGGAPPVLAGASSPQQSGSAPAES